MRVKALAKRGERRACRLTGFSRSALWRTRRGRDDRALRSLAESCPRYGCPTLYAMLKREGLVINPKRTRRLCREEGLQVRGRRRKKLVRPRLPSAIPERLNQRWSMDFLSDQLADGRRFCVLNVTEQHAEKDTLQCGERVKSKSNPGANRPHEVSNSLKAVDEARGNWQFRVGNRTSSTSDTCRPLLK